MASLFSVFLTVCFRQLMVMDETHVVNQMKEDTCYVASDFCADVEIARYRFVQMSMIFLLTFTFFYCVQGASK